MFSDWSCLRKKNTSGGDDKVLFYHIILYHILSYCIIMHKTNDTLLKIILIHSVYNKHKPKNISSGNLKKKYNTLTM